MAAAGTSDVLIVGAGIIGLACAHALLHAGRSVTIVDRHLPGAEQSTKTGGGIRLLHGAAVTTELTRRSMPTWQHFEERFGADPHYRETGHLFLTSAAAGEAALQRQATAQAALGVPLELLTGAEVAQRWPQLRGTRFTAGLHCPVGGYLNQHRVVCGYVRAVQAAGGVVLPGTRVEDLVVEADRVVGARTTAGVLQAGHVVNAAGAAAGAIAAMAGIEIPFESRRHQLLIVRPQAAVPDTTPWLIDVDAQVHLRPDGDGRALVGGFLGHDEPTDPERYDRDYDNGWARRVREAAAASFGLVERDAAIIQGWAGLYPGTVDYLPVLEVSRPGLVTAAGFAGTGLMHAPAVGQIVTDLLDGRPPDLPADLGRARFAHATGAVERTGF